MVVIFKELTSWHEASLQFLQNLKTSSGATVCKGQTTLREKWLSSQNDIHSATPGQTGRHRRHWSNKTQVPEPQGAQEGIIDQVDGRLQGTFLFSVIISCYWLIVYRRQNLRAYSSSCNYQTCTCHGIPSTMLVCGRRRLTLSWRSGETRVIHESSFPSPLKGMQRATGQLL